jgi:hypothetical protein
MPTAAPRIPAPETTKAATGELCATASNPGLFFALSTVRHRLPSDDKQTQHLREDYRTSQRPRIADDRQRSLPPSAEVRIAVRNGCERVSMSRPSYPRRQQYRRLRPAARH